MNFVPNLKHFNSKIIELFLFLHAMILKENYLNMKERTWRQ